VWIGFPEAGPDDPPKGGYLTRRAMSASVPIAVTLSESVFPAARAGAGKSQAIRRAGTETCRDGGRGRQGESVLHATPLRHGDGDTPVLLTISRASTRRCPFRC